MGTKGIDHDTLANRRNRWIGRSGVVSVPSNAQVVLWMPRGPYDTDAEYSTTSKAHSREARVAEKRCG